MPNFETHDLIGTAAGAGYAAYRARGQEPLFQLIETLAGALGGSIGGRLPDLLEPATCPGHRDIAHSVACAGLIVNTRGKLERWSQQVEGTACQTLLDPVPSEVKLGTPPDQVVTALCLVFVVGFVNGLLAGYVSHLALDGCTPAGLPLLTSAKTMLTGPFF